MLWEFGHSRNSLKNTLEGLSDACWPILSGEVSWKVKVKVRVAQWCPTLCDPYGLTIHGILQARIMGRVAFPFSRGSSQPRDRTQVSRIADGTS